MSTTRSVPARGLTAAFSLPARGDKPARAFLIRTTQVVTCTWSDRKAVTAATDIRIPWGNLPSHFLSKGIDAACSAGIGASSEPDKRLVYLFCGNQVAKFDPDANELKGSGLIGNVFSSLAKKAPDFANGVDACFVALNHTAYFFRGGQCATVDLDDMSATKPVSIASAIHDAPAEIAGGIDAAIDNPDTGLGYLFLRDKLVGWDSNKNKADSAMRFIARDWQGLPYLFGGQTTRPILYLAQARALEGTWPPSCSVQVMDTETKKKIAEVKETVEQCTHVSAAPNGKRVYATGRKTGTINVIETATNTAKKTLETGYQGLGKTTVSADSARLYVPVRDQLMVFDTEKLTELPALPIVGAVTALPDGNLLVTSKDTKIVTPAGSTVGTIPNVPATGAVSVDAKGEWAYVGGKSSVTRIDLKARTTSTSPDLGADVYDIALSPDGKRLYVSHHGHNHVSIVDRAQNKKVGEFNEIGNPLRWAVWVCVGADSTSVWVGVSSGTLSEYHAESRKLQHRLENMGETQQMVIAKVP
ncbi:hypothetical protein ATK36_0906 [Amycolatopsis sulphurea]|uniref:YVTN family beta-propeller protein n=1 Tax=Amycolatopsis sulphurea TaxID=76022 RepID=A0A2A9G1P4_9PSEU|nr:hypothetical protein [Amycolatopsis sulphurea]PFG57328.1 hypothetical protein ATK36_0906 [Amycolatopsis sulphurea]